MDKLEPLLKELCLSIGGWTASIMLPDFESNVLYSAVTYNLPPDWAKLTNTFDESTDNGYCFINNKPVIKNNLGLKTLRGSKTHHPVESVIVVPLKKSSRVVGTLVVIADKPKTEFGREELSKMNKAASSFALEIS